MTFIKLCTLIPLALLSRLAFAQHHIIVGRVQDGTSNEPISNAYITSSVGQTISDMSGHFVIKASAHDTLELTHIGYETFTLKTQPRSDTLVIRLLRATIELKAVTILDYMTEETLKNKVLETPVIESQEVKNARENMMKTRILFAMGYRAPMSDVEKFQHYLKGPQNFVLFSSSAGSIFKVIKNAVDRPHVSYKSFNKYSKPAGLRFFVKHTLPQESLLYDSAKHSISDTTATN
jgi:hypothetical protein